MRFDYSSKTSRSVSAIPSQLIDTWKIGSQKYEIRADERYYILDENIPYELKDGGATLDHNGTRYSRVYGNTTELVGVWVLESDPTEEWNLREDGSYTYHWPGHEFFGDYNSTATEMSTTEMRAVLSESGGTLTFDPPYMPSVSGTWSLAEPKLTVTFPSGDVVYTRA